MKYLSVLYQNSYMYIKFHKKINKTIQPGTEKNTSIYCEPTSFGRDLFLDK